MVEKIPMDGVVGQLILARVPQLVTFTVPRRLLDETILFAGVSRYFEIFAAVTASVVDGTANRQAKPDHEGRHFFAELLMTT